MTRKKVTYITVSSSTKEDFEPVDLKPVVINFSRLALDAFWNGLSSEAKRALFRVIPKHKRTRAKYRILISELEAWKKGGGDPGTFLAAKGISARTLQRAERYVFSRKRPIKNKK